MNEHNYYRAFLQAILHGQSHDPQVAALLEQPAFSVYRNTIFKGITDALAANYPAVRRLVGDDWFQTAALAYARGHMPDDACLIDYGSQFPVFLAAAEAAAELPYLAGVAALDRCWSEAHQAADDALLDLTALHAALSDGCDVRLIPHAAARWHWEPMHPCYSIWAANRDPAAAPMQQPEWRGEGALLTRPESMVVWQQISHGACAFLDACRAGDSVSSAASQALAHEPGLDASTMLNALLQAGAFTSFHRRRTI